MTIWTRCEVQSNKLPQPLFLFLIKQTLARVKPKRLGFPFLWFTSKSAIKQSPQNSQYVPWRWLWKPYSRNKNIEANTMTGWLWQREPLLLPLIIVLTVHGFSFFYLFVKLHVQACPVKALQRTATCCKFSSLLSLQAALSAGQTQWFVFIF